MLIHSFLHLLSAALFCSELSFSIHSPYLEPNHLLPSWDFAVVGLVSHTHQPLSHFLAYPKLVWEKESVLICLSCQKGLPKKPRFSTRHKPSFNSHVICYIFHCQNGLSLARYVWDFNFIISYFTLVLSFLYPCSCLYLLVSNHWVWMSPYIFLNKTMKWWAEKIHSYYF